MTDKTDSGSHGSTNTIAVVWPPRAALIVIVIFFTQPVKDANTRSDIMVAALDA